MWNEKTKQLVADGKLVVLGVVQEQHAERAELYKQWKQYDFPIVQDSNTELGLGVVPVPILIDEYGYVQSSKPSLRSIEKLVATTSAKPAKPAPVLNATQRTIKWLESNGDQSTPTNALAVADQHIRQANVESVRKAIKLYEQCDTEDFANSKKTNRGALYFRLGVAYRMLYDMLPEGERNVSDFNKAATYWSKALSENPRQYIWRRRIEQYGPVQIKPYPFYNWVEQANKEITARGETPVELKTSLSEAETAEPSRKFAASAPATNPDPDSEIELDQDGLVEIKATVVPAIIKPGQTVRVHLQFAPNLDGDAKWNNESSELVVWLNESASGKSTKTLLRIPNPNSAESSETRKFEFEFKTSKTAKVDSNGMISVKGYGLYNVCKTEDGQCLFRRQDFSISIPILSAASKE